MNGIDNVKSQNDSKIPVLKEDLVEEQPYEKYVKSKDVTRATKARGKGDQNKNGEELTAQFIDYLILQKRSQDGSKASRSGGSHYKSQVSIVEQ